MWVRTTGTAGVGKPLYKRQEPLRQRIAMRELRCQVCARPTEQTERGTLWLLPSDSTPDRTVLPGELTVAFPPICPHCARVSVRLCPRLRERYVLVYARSRVCGVDGILFAPGRDKPAMSWLDRANLIVPHDSPLAPWMLALQLHRTLSQIVPVGWDLYPLIGGGA